jgi:hypothetical protein
VAVRAWFLANPGTALTLVGLTSYLVFRVAFLIYYRRFGVTPEEVGMDYVAILIAQAAGGLLEILLVVGIVVGLRVAMARGRMPAERPSDEGTLQSYMTALKARPGPVRSWVTWLPIGVPLAYLSFVVVDAMRAGRDARIPSLTEPFQGRAIPVAVYWLDPPGPGANPRLITPADLGAGTGTTAPEFLLLGSRDGVMVLYEQRLGTVRLPGDKVLLVSVPPPDADGRVNR